MHEINQPQRALLLSFFLILCFAGSILNGDELTTVYTPEGKSLLAMIKDEFPDPPSPQYWISYYDSVGDAYVVSEGLDAERIGHASATYNCHGYAWSKSEGGETVWISTPTEFGYWSDTDYANDGSASYITATELAATHVSYVDYNHSARQVAYQRYESKWGYWGLYNHAKGDDPFADEETEYLFKKLKTTHYGTLSNYPKTWVGAGGQTHTLTGNTILPNDTLTIKTDVTVNLGSYYLKSTGGTIVRQSGVTFTPKDVSVKSGSTLLGQYPTIQTAITNASSGQDVWVESGTYTEDLLIENKNIDLKSVSGRPTIDGSVYFKYADGVLDGFYVTGTISFYESYAGVYDIRSESGDTLLYVGDYSEVEVIDFNSWSSFDTGVWNYLSEVYLDGVEIDGADEKAVYQPYDYSYTEFNDFYFCDNNYDIYKEYYSDVYIEDDNTFSGYIYDYCYGVQPAQYPSSYDECSLKKKSVNILDLKAVSGDAHQPTTVEVGTAPLSTAGDEAYNLGMSLLREINKQRAAAIRADTTWNARDFAGQYAEAIAVLKQALADSLDSYRAWVAIGKIVSSYWRLDQAEEVYQYLTTLREDPEYAAIRPIIDNRLISYYLRQGKPASALEVGNDLLATSLDDGDRAALLYRMGNIYLRLMNDPAQAAVYFRQVVINYPEDPASDLARAKLVDMGEAVPVPDEPEIAEQVVEELSLSGYPNPFNPTATVRFGLPEGGNVTLVVYDLMGREVVRLVEGHREAGWQAVVWDGRDGRGREVPTGIYIARLVTPQGTRAIKLVMMK